MQIQPFIDHKTTNNMNEQQQQPNQPQLPYEPIKFVYTQTIGSIDEKFRQIIDPYTWTYEDLLQPKIIYGKSKIEYYLFHVAPIYNWLRHVGSEMLAEYVMKVDDNKGKGNNFNFNNNFKNSNNNKSTSTMTPFSLQTWKFQMKHYIAQWQIAKLCASAKIKILTTRTENNEKGNKNYMNGKNNNNKKQKHNEQQILCTHLIKKDKFTTDYVLNTLSTTDKQNNNNLPKLQCPMIYCQQCQQQIKIKSQIIKYPFAPYFNKYHDKEFTIITNQLQKTKITYQLLIIYCLDKVYVKSSGGVWYQMLFKENKKSIVSFQRIDHKAGLVFVYQQKVNAKGDKVLRKAQPVKVQQMKKDEKGLVDLAKFITKERNVNGDDDSQEDQKLKDYKQKILQKPNNNKPNVTETVVTKKPQTTTKNQQTHSKIDSQQEQIQQQQQQDDDQPLQDMTKNPLPIVLNKKKTQRKLFKQYKKTVQSLLPKPKQKDQYQRQYDKGKTKKIHKNRQQFRTADFFQLYNKIKGNKSNNSVQKQRQNDNNKDDMLNEGNERSQVIRDGNRRGRDNGNNENGDDDYNIVCQAKRSDRFSRGRGGRGGRGGRFGDRDSGRSRGRGGSRGGSQRGGGFKSYGDKHRNGNSHSNSNSNSYNNNKGHNRNYSNKNNNTQRNNKHNSD